MRSRYSRAIDADLYKQYDLFVDYHDYIDIDPAVRSGKPHIEGSRITVSDVLEYLASGMSATDVCADLPELTPAHIQACLRVDCK